MDYCFRLLVRLCLVCSSRFCGLLVSLLVVSRLLVLNLCNFVRFGVRVWVRFGGSFGKVLVRFFRVCSVVCWCMVLLLLRYWWMLCVICLLKCCDSFRYWLSNWKGCFMVCCDYYRVIFRVR